MNSIPEILTERLLLRELRPTDLGALAQLNADPKVMQYFPATLSREQSDAFAGRIREHWAKHGFGQWGLARRDEGLRLGEVVAFTVPQNQRSRRVMEKLGMTRSATEDFDHPSVPERHPLRRHVLYRIQRASWDATSGCSGG